jgi:hypothetical protein
MFHFWLILLSAKVVRILRPHRAGPTAETIHMEIQRGGSRVNAQWGVNMQQRIILPQAFIEQLTHERSQRGILTLDKKRFHAWLPCEQRPELQRMDPASGGSCAGTPSGA